MHILDMGASTVKCTKKLLRCTKTIKLLVNHLKAVAKCCLNWVYFHGSIYCCVRYSNIEYQDEIFKLVIKNIIQKVVAKSGFGYRF
jgi:hypothetical protein